MDRLLDPMQRYHGASHIEVANDFAVVFVVKDSRFARVDTYDNWKAALEAAGLRE